MIGTSCFLKLSSVRNHWVFPHICNHLPSFISTEHQIVFCSSYSHPQNAYRHVYDFDINLSPFLLSFHESCYASVRVLGMQLQSVPAGLSRGKARSRQELQGQWDSAMCVFVCARVGAGGGRRWEGCLRTLTAPVAWAMTAGVEEASRRSIVAELDPCNRGAIGCSALGLNDINPDV